MVNLFYCVIEIIYSGFGDVRMTPMIAGLGEADSAIAADIIGA
jgi:hypothetical protein